MTLFNRMQKDLTRGFSFTVFISVLITQVGCTKSGSPPPTTAQSSPNSNEKVLNMGLSADYPPFEFKKDGEVVGLDVDVAREIGKELGYTVSIQDIDFSGLIPSLQSGRSDFVMSGMTKTPERAKNVDFSDIYFVSSFAVVVDKKTPFVDSNDLKGKKIGAQLGSTMEKYARAKAATLPGMEVVALNKNPTLIQEIKAGRLDGMISEDVQAFAFVEANPGLKFVALTESSGDLNADSEAKEVDGYAIAFPKDSAKGSQLRDQFNGALRKLKSSGKLEKLKQKWLGR